MGEYIGIKQISMYTVFLLMAWISSSNSQHVQLPCDQTFGNDGEPVTIQCNGTTLANSKTLDWYKLSGTKILVYRRLPNGVAINIPGYSDRFDIEPGSDCSLRINNTIASDYNFTYQVEDDSTPLPDIDQSRLIHKQTEPGNTYFAVNGNRTATGFTATNNGIPVTLTGNSSHTPASEVKWYCYSETSGSQVLETGQPVTGLGTLSITSNYQPPDANGCQTEDDTTSAITFVINDAAAFIPVCERINASVQLDGNVIAVRSWDISAILIVTTPECTSLIWCIIVWILFILLLIAVISLLLFWCLPWMCCFVDARLCCWPCLEDTRFRIQSCHGKCGGCICLKEEEHNVSFLVNDPQEPAKSSLGKAIGTAVMAASCKLCGKCTCCRRCARCCAWRIDADVEVVVVGQNVQANFKTGQTFEELGENAEPEKLKELLHKELKQNKISAAGISFVEGPKPGSQPVSRTTESL